MLVGLVGSPRSWPSASHCAAATGEESGRKKMTGGTALSERERERESARASERVRPGRVARPGERGWAARAGADGRARAHCWVGLRGKRRSSPSYGFYFSFSKM
jgi:hypothetical protein